MKKKRLASFKYRKYDYEEVSVENNGDDVTVAVYSRKVPSDGYDMRLDVWIEIPEMTLRDINDVEALIRLLHKVKKKLPKTIKSHVSDVSVM